ncbi:MAG: hypothetical protein OSJ36_08820 [Odoribacter sp.]|nr:hypothetical protein [Odoribacter sp.]
MKKNILYILLLSLCLLVSCRSIMYRLIAKGTNAPDKAASMLNQKTGQHVIVVPLMHTGTEDYYKKVKDYLTCLRNDGYIVYYEGIGTVDFKLLADSLRPKYDTIQRKFRKVTGMHLTGYDETNNQSLPFKTKGTQVAETPELKGITDNDIHADFFIAELVKRYETAKGEIVLTDYDFQTDLLAKYKLSRAERKKYSSFFMLQTLRNNYVGELLKTYQHPKVVIAYGAGHYWFLIAKLQDLGFEKIEKNEN